MAPEVLTQNGGGYNLAVDYWSIGCILFECLAGYYFLSFYYTFQVLLNYDEIYRISSFYCTYYR
jgi:cell cycle protein kinase DBF2